MGKVLVLLFIISMASVAQAASRVALVVGNGAYQAQRLANPTNDAQDIATTLRQLGFQVDLVKDTDRANLHRAIQRFRAKLNSNTEVALFFYAGHGAQFEGNSYLLPLRANIQTAADLEIEALSAKSILSQMRSTGSLVNVMVLDACRNLPFPALNRGDRGLARIETIGSALLAFATSPGQVAADGHTRNSPYTAQLLKLLKKPNLPLSQLFNDVGFAVQKSTGGRQTPWVNSSPMPTIYLAGTGQRPVVTPTKPIKDEVNKPVVTAASIQRFKVNGDGTVSDSKVGVMWKQCVEGLSGNICGNGAIKPYSWHEAFGLKGSNFAGYSDWRLPTKEELRSLVFCSNGTSVEGSWEFSCSGKSSAVGNIYSRPTIDTTIFPNTRIGWYWSSSVSSRHSDISAWTVSVYDGKTFTFSKDARSFVRLVRNE